MRVSKTISYIWWSVYLFTYIVGLKCIQRIVQCQIEQVINVIITKHGDKMGTLGDCINMNNSRALWDRIDNPHASIIIWWIRDVIVPINESTGVFNILIRVSSDVNDLQWKWYVLDVIVPHCHWTLKLTWLQLPWSQITVPCSCSMFVLLPNSLSFTPSIQSLCLCLKLPRTQTLYGVMRRQRSF